MFECESDELFQMVKVDDVAFSGSAKAPAPYKPCQFAFGFWLDRERDGFIVLWRL